MHQHRQRYFHARHRRPSPAIKWHHAARVRIRFPQPGARQGRHAARPAARSAAAARSRTGRRAPAARGRARCAPAVRGRRHGLAAASRELRQHPARPGSKRRGTHRAFRAVRVADRVPGADRGAFRDSAGPRSPFRRSVQDQVRSQDPETGSSSKRTAKRRHSRLRSSVYGYRARLAAKGGHGRLTRRWPRPPCQRGRRERCWRGSTTPTGG